MKIINTINKYNNNFIINNQNLELDNDRTKKGDNEEVSQKE